MMNKTLPTSIDPYPALRRPEPGRRGQRIPFVQQLEATDCGAACLAMVLAYHGRHERLDTIREVMGTDRDGATALAILNAAGWFDLHGRGLGLDIDDLAYLEPGTILHWEFNHFVVFERLHKDGIMIVDPAAGRR